jgi:phosphorylcholine metabolism protein LicD
MNIYAQEVRFTAPKKVLSLYQLMKDVHELFASYTIQYWIDSGTLLGAVRHAGIIPWDNDLDLCMSEDNEQKLLDLEPVLEQLGLSLLQKPFGWCIKARGASCDIFLTREKKGRYFYADKNTQTFYATRDGGPVFYWHDELFPLKLYTFGQIEVWGPHDPYTYLDVYYPSWDSTAKFLIDHKNNRYADERMKLTAQDKVPALPLGPLQDRVRGVIDML